MRRWWACLLVWAAGCGGGHTSVALPEARAETALLLLETDAGLRRYLLGPQPRQPIRLAESELRRLSYFEFPHPPELVPGLGPLPESAGSTPLSLAGPNRSLGWSGDRWLSMDLDAQPEALRRAPVPWPARSSDCRALEVSWSRPIDLNSPRWGSGDGKGGLIFGGSARAFTASADGELSELPIRGAPYVGSTLDPEGRLWLSREDGQLERGSMGTQTSSSGAPRTEVWGSLPMGLRSFAVRPLPAGAIELAGVSEDAGLLHGRGARGALESAVLAEGSAPRRAHTGAVFDTRGRAYLAHPARALAQVDGGSLRWIDDAQLAAPARLLALPWGALLVATDGGSLVALEDGVPRVLERPWLSASVLAAAPHGFLWTAGGSAGEYRRLPGGLCPPIDAYTGSKYAPRVLAPSGDGWLLVVQQLDQFEGDASLVLRLAPAP